MFKRYCEVMLRLEELCARTGKLSNSDRHELQSLLEEQAWLGTTMVKKAKSVLEEIDNTFEKLFDWMIDISDLIDRATGESGTPEDLLELEKNMADAVILRDQMKRLNLDKHITRVKTERAVHPMREARLEAASAAATVYMDDPSVSVPNQVGVVEPRQNPLENISNDTEPPLTLVANLETPAVSPVTVESFAVVPAGKSGPAYQKSRKKKVKKAKLLTGEQYRPPQELLSSIVEKITLPAQPKYPIELQADVEKFISFNLSESKK